MKINEKKFSYHGDYEINIFFEQSKYNLNKSTNTWKRQKI